MAKVPGKADAEPPKSISMFASGAGDSVVKVWKVDESTGDDTMKRSDKDSPGYVLAHTLTAHHEKVTCVAFDPVGGLLASGSADKSVLLWKPDEGSLHATMEDLREGPLCLAFDTTGEMLAIGGWDQMIQLRKVEDGSVLASLKGHTSAVTSLAFAPNGSTLASSSRDGTVRLWSVAPGNLSPDTIALLERHSGVVTCVAFSFDGALVASGGHDTRVMVWETAALTGGVRPTANANTDSLAGAPSSSLASCHTLIENGHTEYVLDLAFPQRKGRILASASADKRILLWSMELFELLWCCEGHTGPVNSLQFSSDGSILVSGSRDRTIRTWAIASREVDGAELWSGECTATLEPKPDGHSMNIECVAVVAVDMEEPVEEEVGMTEEELEELEAAMAAEEDAAGAEAPAGEEGEEGAEAAAEEVAPPAEEAEAAAEEAAPAEE